MRQAGAAVGAAGEVGLVHRDIKPENLLLTKKGQVKVADFGLCRDLDSDRHHVTQPGVTMGTPLYMSPEQARGQAMDHRSDLYSLGVTYYHMLAGHPPFRAETALALAMKHVVDTPVDLSVHRPDLPPGPLPAGDEADGQAAGRPLPVGGRDAPRPVQDPRVAPGLGPDGGLRGPDRGPMRRLSARPSTPRRSRSPPKDQVAEARREGPRGSWPGRARR